MRAFSDIWRRCRDFFLGDPSVHDTLSCVLLAVVGAGATAAAAASAASGNAPAIAFLPLAGGVATSAAANLATNVWQRIDRAAAEKLLSGWKGIDENHVVVRALRRAYLDALRAVLARFRAVIATDPDREFLERFADDVATFARVEWRAAERLASHGRDGFTPAESAIRRAVLDALPVNFGSALARRHGLGSGPDAAFEALRDALVEGALAEVRSRTLPEDEGLPATFTALFRGEGAPDSWFDLFVRAAAERLKGEDAFTVIWGAEQQAHVRQVTAAVAERVEQIDRMVGAPTRCGDASVSRFKEAIQGRPTNLHGCEVRLTRSHG